MLFKEFFLCCTEQHVPRRITSLLYKAGTMLIDVEVMTVKREKKNICFKNAKDKCLEVQPNFSRWLSQVLQRQSGSVIWLPVCATVGAWAFSKIKCTCLEELAMSMTREFRVI